MTMNWKRLSIVITLILLAHIASTVSSFASVASARVYKSKTAFHRISPTHLLAINNSGLRESDQGVVGAVGSVMALTVFFSEFTLFSTGCGLPAGPFGLIGLAEGLSYFGMVGISGYSVFVKFRTGNGLPAGPLGLLGAAEGLSFLAMIVGSVVLVAQIVNYGYIPNAVPMEGGMCS